MVLHIRGWRELSLRRWKLHLWRNLAHFWGQMSWFYAIFAITLAEVFAIEFTTPIWTVLLAALLLGERLNVWRCATVACGFAGVLIMLRPGVEALSPAHMVMLAGAVGFALSVVATKSLTADESPFAILFYMNVIQLPLGLVPALPVWVWPSAVLWPWVVVVGLTGLSAHYALARALTYGDASVVMPFDFLRLPLITAIGFLLYGEAVSLWVLAGAVVIFAGNYLNVIETRRLQPK